MVADGRVTADGVFTAADVSKPTDGTLTVSYGTAKTEIPVTISPANPFTDVKGHSTAIAISDPGEQTNYKAFPIGFDYSNREWFIQPMKTGKLNIMNVHQSQITGQLIITVSTVITDANDEITGVLGADIQLEEIMRRAEALEAEQNGKDEE